MTAAAEDGDRLRRLFAEAGVDGWLHATDLDGRREVRFRSGEVVVLASVVKIAALWSSCSRASTVAS